MRRSKSLHDVFRRRGLENSPSLRDTVDELNSVATTVNSIPQHVANSVIDHIPKTYRGLFRHLSFTATSLGVPGKCCLCLGEVSRSVQCKSTDVFHFFCEECFSMYVHSLCEETFKLVATSGRITCPVPNCNSEPWSSHEIRLMLDGPVLEEYIDAIIGVMTRTQIQPHDESCIEDVKVVENALTLVCPNYRCETALDPLPDGCCAMKCLTCGSHFCWLCFSIQDNQHRCHAHVLKCPENPVADELFVPKQQVEIVHKRRRIEAIRRGLQKIDGALWQTSQRCRIAVDACAVPMLRVADVTPEEIFKDTATRPPVSVVSNQGAFEGQRLQQQRQQPRHVIPPLTREQMLSMLRAFLTTYFPMAISSWIGGIQLICMTRDIMGWPQTWTAWYLSFLVKSCCMFALFTLGTRRLPTLLGVPLTPQVFENIYGAWLSTQFVLARRNDALVGLNPFLTFPLVPSTSLAANSAIIKCVLTVIMATVASLFRHGMTPAELGTATTFIVLSLCIDTIDILS